MKKIVAVLFLCVLQSCIYGRSKTSSFYGFRAVENEVMHKYKHINKTILVNNVKIPSYIDKPQIITMKENRVEYNITETSCWIEPLDTMVQDTLYNNLKTYLPSSNIKKFTIGEKYYDYLITVDVVRIDAILNKNVNFECYYYINDSKGNTIFSDNFKKTLDLNDGYVDLVDKESFIIAVLAEDIAGNLSTIIVKKNSR